MNTLVPIIIESVYPTKSNKKIDLPERLAKCTPDTARALYAIKDEVEAAGGILRLSDLFRSYEQQDEAHKRQPRLSPAPGGSNHEAGRAFDIDLSVLGIPLHVFWSIGAAHGVTPIISTPNSRLKEAWHFECLGSHRRLRILGSKYPALSGILDLGLRVDKFPGSRRDIAWMQCALHRLGKNPGAIDGRWGPKSRTAAERALHESLTPYAIPTYEVDLLLKATFPEEYDKNITVH